MIYYKYSDFKVMNENNKKVANTEKLKILNDKNEVESLCKTYENPKVNLSNGVTSGIVLNVSVLVELVMRNKAALSNPSYIRGYKGFK